MSNYIMLSFDVEEFDIPLEYNHKIEMSEQMLIGKRGLDAILPTIEAHNITTTMFTTANFAMYYPDTIKALAYDHEIASHTFFHSSFKNEDLLKSRLKLEEIIGMSVKGLRMPRMKKVDMALVKKAGYSYDSSIHPTWIPGRYNNLKLPRTMYAELGVQCLPASVSPNLRLPLFWLAFKNYPYHFFKRLVLKTLKKDGYVCLYFHPWEFTDINNYSLPNYVKKHCGAALVERLSRLIEDLKPHGKFITIQDFMVFNDIA